MLNFSKTFHYITQLISDQDSPYVRLAETEYATEFRLLSKTLGRRPSQDEAKLLILNCR